MSVICRLPGCRPTGVSMCSLELSASSRGRSGRCEMGWMLRRSPTYDARRGGRGGRGNPASAFSLSACACCARKGKKRGRPERKTQKKETRRATRLGFPSGRRQAFPTICQSRDAAGSYGRSLTQTGCALLWLAHPSQGWANQKRAKGRPLCVRSVCACGEAGRQSSHTKNGIRFW